ncbi:phosphotransferase family protein [Nocardia sp. NPDC059240]|uniref:phosphotransferase family protein n=1 Tax=Nocardia sp. NPDC059240 TaxID=3346786 RepID=UPI0036A64253
MGYSSSRTYRVIAGDATLVVKVNDDPTVLASAARNLRTLAGLGIPVPIVVAYDDTRRHVPGGLLVMSHIEGRDLRHELPTMTKSQMTALARTIVGFQRLAATLPATGGGCGYVGIGECAERNWLDIVRRPNHDRYADPLPTDAIALDRRVAAAIELASGYLTEVRPTCFLDDLTTKNVMVRDGELCGVVDFDCVAFGDPLFHLGLTAAAVTVDTPPHCRFYVDELLRFSDATTGLRRRIVDLYEAVFLVAFLSADPPHDVGDCRVVAGDTAGRRLADVEDFFMPQS